MLTLRCIHNRIIVCNTEIGLWGAALYHKVQRIVALKQKEEASLIVAVAAQW